MPHEVHFFSGHTQFSFHPNICYTIKQISKIYINKNNSNKVSTKLKKKFKKQLILIKHQLHQKYDTFSRLYIFIHISFLLKKSHI